MSATPPPSAIRRHVWVAGRVQGVWFRDACQREARRLGVAGWVRNLRDGRVEVAIEGAPDAVNALANWCQHGPPRAEVAAITIEDEPPEGLTGFAVVG